jgi:hypothetical protein
VGEWSGQTLTLYLRVRVTLSLTLYLTLNVRRELRRGLVRRSVADRFGRSAAVAIFVGRYRYCYLRSVVSCAYIALAAITYPPRRSYRR